MTIPINLPGRVESDPMRIPTAASMATGRDDRFDRFLREAVQTDERHTDFGPRANDEPTPVTDEVVSTDVDTPEATEKPAPVEVEAAEQEEQLPEQDTGPEPTADVTESTRRGEPERQETAGKGTDSPRTSTNSNEPLLLAVLQSKQTGAASNTIATQPGVQPVAAAAGRSVDPTVRGADGIVAGGRSTPGSKSVQAGYATGNAASAQLLEQARDSIFKQILMKLTDDGGEMRVHLQPPELGDLDLLLSVEGGNRLSLAIASDRPDVSQLLQRHLDELKQTLQQNGLEITSAEVQTRSEFQSDRRRADAQAGGSAHHDDIAEGAVSAPRSGGYITAEGLDYWV